MKLWGPDRRVSWDVKRGRWVRWPYGFSVRKLRSVLAVPLAQARAGGGEAVAGGPWEVPLMTSRPWRRRRDVRKCDIATSLGGGGLSNAPAVHQRGTSARPLAICPIVATSECCVRVQWVECARPHEDPAERAGTFRRVSRSDPGAARILAGTRQACARSAPAGLYDHLCVYFRFRCVEPPGVRLLLWNCRDDGHRLECEVRSWRPPANTVPL